MSSSAVDALALPTPSNNRSDIYMAIALIGMQ